jgi:hypothetical protein
MEDRMKVVGTGDPRMLTVRFKTCELRVLREEIEEREHSALRSMSEIEASGLRDARREEVERLKDDLFLLSRLRDDLRAARPPDQPVEVTAPTEVLSLVIRGAAGENVHRLREAVDQFREDRGTPTTEQLRALLSATSASIESLIGSDHALNHGVE